MDIYDIDDIGSGGSPDAYGDRGAVQRCTFSKHCYNAAFPRAVPCRCTPDRGPDDARGQLKIDIV